MIKDFKKIKNWFVKKTDTDPFKYEPNPAQDWMIMLTVMMVLILSFFVGQYLLFQRLTNIENSIDLNKKSSTSTLDSEAVRLIELDVQKRKVDFAKWQSTTPEVVDPSL